MKAIRLLPVLLALIFSACTTGQQEPGTLETPGQVLEAMKAEYDGSWYKTLTFVQETIQFRSDGSVDTTLWYEALELPGKLRIDIEEPNSGNALMFRSDSLFVFRDGNLVNAGRTYHPLLLLGFDAYFLETTDLMAKLDSLEFNLDIMHESTWQDRPVYVIGAEEGDFETPQFWIDQERLYFVRMFQRVGLSGESIQEVQFNGYEEIGGGWVAPRVVFYQDGSLTLIELYSDMNAGVEFDDRLFSPIEWATADHWYQQPD